MVQLDPFKKISYALRIYVTNESIKKFNLRVIMNEMPKFLRGS